MGNRSAKIMFAMFAGIVAGAPLPAMSQTAPDAADNCLAAPKGATPQGQHWYYRLERGTQRKCWYLRDEGPRQDQATQAPADSQKAAASAPRAVQDAHAELTSPQAAPAQDAPAAVPAPNAAAAPLATTPPSTAPTGGAAQQPAASVWPDPAGVTAAPVPQPAPPPKVADRPADARPAPRAAASPAPMPLAAADVPAYKPTGSLQTLLLVISGALALAGIIGSIIYRFAGSRVRVQAPDGARRRVDWGQPAQSRAPWTDRVQDYAPPAERLRARTPRPPRTIQTLETMETIEMTQAPDLAGNGIAPPSQATENRATQAVDVDAIALEIERLAKEARSEAPDAPSEPQEPSSVSAEPADDAVDIDVITQMLERLAQEGPKLDPSLDSRPGRPIAEAGPGDFAQSRPARPGVRA